MSKPLHKLIRRFRYGAPIIVVSGLPRSGTSMTMKMLEAGGLTIVQDGIRTADEDNPKGYYEFEPVKNLHETADKLWLKEARGKAVKIISYLLKTLPPENNYKVLFSHRNLREIIASQNKMLTRRGEKTDSSDERMMELLDQDVRDAQFFLRRRAQFEVLNLQYREGVENPREQARLIAEFLELPLDLDKMASVADKQLYRNRA